MAKKRLIDTEELYFDAELINLLGPRGLHLYIRLWGLAEDWGGYEPKYDNISLKMGALRFKPKEVEKNIQNLIKMGKIIEYQNNGKPIHWIVNLMKHQPLDNPSPPRLPLPEWIACELREYKSGKKYAVYTIIPEKLPVVYQSATRNSVTNRIVTNRIVTEKKHDLVDFEKSTLASWNSFCDKFPSLSKIKEVSNSRRKHLKQRFEEPAFRDFGKLLEAIEAQPFLIHGNPNNEKHKNWHIDFDWLIKNDTNYLKVLEFKYRDNSSGYSELQKKFGLKEK